MKKTNIQEMINNFATKNKISAVKITQLIAEISAAQKNSKTSSDRLRVLTFMQENPTQRVTVKMIDEMLGAVRGSRILNELADEGILIRMNGVKPDGKRGRAPYEFELSKKPASAR
jgi:hypothetical protein